MKILIVDDEENVRKGLVTFLELSGYKTLAVGNLAAARASLADAGSEVDSFLAAIVDVFIGDEDGSLLIDNCEGRTNRRVPVVMISGRAAIKDAVTALRKGAYDFLEKPIDTDRLLAILRNLEREAEIERRVEALRATWRREHLFSAPGTSFAAVVDQAERIARSPLSVLINGATGTGKELIAQWIHLSSPRSQGPFVTVNCSAIPPDLAESAFFGHRKGSFTGAASDSAGYFKAASGGTLFLDEIGEIPLALQAKLLRAAESGEIQQIGSTTMEKTDVRIVAATNRDLSSMIKSGMFREDLYWRLAQATLKLPGLSERKTELRDLALFLAEPIRSRIGPDAPRLGEAAFNAIENREWPGNVRELRATLERALWLAPRGGELDPEYLNMNALSHSREPESGPQSGSSQFLKAPLFAELYTGMTLSEAKNLFERAYVESVLEAAGGSVTRAASSLGLRPNNLSRKLKELGIRK
jgi:DNA-binding NtrC family response regulator